MVKPLLEVKVSKNTLCINKNELSLDDKLSAVGISKLLDNPTETSLELKYELDNFSPEDEANKIYSFLEQYNLNKKIDINSDETEKDFFNKDFSSIIALTGKFNATVYD